MKVLVLANNCKWKSWPAKLEALKAWFAPVVDLEFTLEHTSFTDIKWNDYTFKPAGKPEVKYRGIDGNWYDKNIAKPSKKKGYDIVIFTLPTKQWEAPGVNGWHTSASEGIQEIHIGCNERGIYWYNNIKHPGDKWFNIARHELCHALYEMQGKYDRTHYHWESGQLANVLDDLQLPKMKTVTLTRTEYTGKQTLGFLQLGAFKCKTLERAWKNNERNISCIPKGEYVVKWTFSPKFMRYTYEIQNVPNRSGIRIHVANYWYQINGCIALGSGFSDINSDGELDVINSKNTITQLEQLLNKESFTLIIN
jgi:hypothetical protein